MDLIIIIKIVASLLFICGVILLAGSLLKKYGNIVNFRGNNRFIKIKDSMYINDRNRIILIKMDQVEHLILLSKDGNLILGSNITNKEKQVDEK